MANELKTKVEGALRAACQDDPGAIIELESVEPGRLAGVVLSDSFGRLSPLERQNKIWKQLDLSLSPLERTKIVFIVTDTPDEHRTLQQSG